MHPEPSDRVELNPSDGRDLLIEGSSTIYLPLLAAGLNDRLILMTFPVLLGNGKRIFDGSEQPGGVELVDHYVSDKGVVFTTYEPAGEVPAGSFETWEPVSIPCNLQCPSCILHGKACEGRGRLGVSLRPNSRPRRHFRGMRPAACVVH